MGVVGHPHYCGHRECRTGHWPVVGAQHLLKETLPWPHNSFIYNPMCLLCFTAKVLEKSCPYALSPLLIRLSSHALLKLQALPLQWHCFFRVTSDHFTAKFSGNLALNHLLPLEHLLLASKTSSSLGSPTTLKAPLLVSPYLLYL